MYHELTGHLLIVNVEPQTSLCGAGGGVGLVTVEVDTNHEGLDIGEHSLTCGGAGWKHKQHATVSETLLCHYHIIHNMINHNHVSCLLLVGQRS